MILSSFSDLLNEISAKTNINTKDLVFFAAIIFVVIVIAFVSVAEIQTR